MKDIKSLYLTAKSRGWDSDIKSYNEAIHELLESNPNDYVTNLEYIITSSDGINTFKEFVNKYGLSLAIVDTVESIVESCIHKCERDEKDASAFIEAREFIESFRKDHANEIAMFEWYKIEDEVQRYIGHYYHLNEGVQLRRIPGTMIRNFDEMAVADLLITAKELNATNKILQYIESSNIGDPLFYEYMSTIVEDDYINEHKASTIVENVHNKNHNVYREAVLSDYDLNEVEYEYSDAEVNAIKDLISFKEYQILSEGVDQQKLLTEIFSLYEELQNIDMADSTDESNKGAEDLVPILCLLRHYDENKELPEEIKQRQEYKDVISRAHLTKNVSGGDNYSHAVIAFDPECKEMYSYESGGILRDDWSKLGWSITSSIYIAVVFLPKEDKERIRQMCRDFVEHQDTTKYAYSDLIRLVIGSKPAKEDRRFVCSSFTGFLLAAANPKNIHKDYSEVRPEDVIVLPRAFYVANVVDRDDFAAKKDMIKAKIEAIKKDNLEELEDYNNELPKILLQDTMRKKKTLDKILDYFMNKGAMAGKEKYSNEEGKEE